MLLKLIVGISSMCIGTSIVRLALNGLTEVEYRLVPFLKLQIGQSPALISASKPVIELNAGSIIINSFLVFLLLPF